MPMDCVHNIPEVKKGIGPCDIRSEVKKRNGKPNFWCHTHGVGASAPDGAALPRCPGAWFDAVPDESQLAVDLADGEYAFWGAVEPAIQVGTVPREVGKVHVHHRPLGGAAKDVDKSFDIVTVRNGEHAVVIDGMAAVAYSLSELSGVSVAPLACSHCGEIHIDELKFATHPHLKHLCNSCGRNFRAGPEASVSNPLADAYERLGLARPPVAEATERPLVLESDCYEAVALWPSNSAIVSTMKRAEDRGVHVHAWMGGTQILDETYSPVILDGQLIDEHALRALAVQRAVAHGAPVLSMPCNDCGTSLLSPAGGWMEPRTVHVCASCGKTMRTRLRVFLNPLADKSA